MTPCRPDWQRCEIAQHDHTTDTDKEGRVHDEPVPMTCNDCDRPAFYDYGDEAYHHAVEPERGCFLIPAEAAA